MIAAVFGRRKIIGKGEGGGGAGTGAERFLTIKIMAHPRLLDPA